MISKAKGVRLLIQMVAFTWKKRTATIKTLEHFKVYFHEAHYELQEKITAGQSGYHDTISNIFSVGAAETGISQKQTYGTTIMAKICRRYLGRPNPTLV